MCCTKLLVNCITIAYFQSDYVCYTQVHVECALYCCNLLCIVTKYIILEQLSADDI